MGVHIDAQKHANCFDQVFLSSSFLPQSITLIQWFPNFFTWWHSFKAVKISRHPCCSPVATGGALVGLAPPNKVPSSPNRNMKHYKALESLSNFPYSKSDCDAWTLFLFADMVRSFAHMALGISDRNTGRITDSARTWDL